MKTLNKVYYHQLEKVKDILKVKELFCIPVLGEGLSEEEVEEINMDNFIFPGKRNWDWYFTKDNGSEYIEKYQNVYFSKEALDKFSYEYVDYFPDVDLYLYVKIGEVNGILLDPKDYFKLYLEPDNNANHFSQYA